MAKKKWPGVAPQGGMAGAHTAPPKMGKVSQNQPAPNNGSSFRGKQPSGTKANDSKKAK